MSKNLNQMSKNEEKANEEKKANEQNKEKANKQNKERANEQYDDVVFRATRSWGALSDV